MRRLGDAYRAFDRYQQRHGLLGFPLAYLYLGLLFALSKTAGFPPLLASFHEWAWFFLYAAEVMEQLAIFLEDNSSLNSSSNVRCFRDSQRR